MSRVISVITALSTGPTGLLAQAESPPVVDANVRARWILALVGLLILGVGWITIVWLAGRMTRRFTESDKLGTPSIYSEFGRSDWVKSNRHKTTDEHESDPI